MKINDILLESSPEGSNDYQQMMDMVRGNPMPGVPPEQRVALALFKELQKQKQHNAELDSELNAAERRIDQATTSGELQGQELGMHRGELERERTRGTQQKASIDKLGQTYAQREEASEQQVKELSDKLEAVKSMPGVNQDSVDRLEKQIRELGQNGIGADKVEELERSIAAIQSAESTDDAAIKDLIQQVKAAQDATAELSKAKAGVSKDAEETAKQALDQIDQIKKQLAHFQTVENETTLLAQQVNKIAQKQNIADKLQTANLPASTADMARRLAVDQGVNVLSTPTSPQMSLPGVDTPAPTTGNQLELPGVGQPETEPDRAQNLTRRIKQQLTPATVNNVYESAFNRSVAWATGKTL